MSNGQTVRIQRGTSFQRKDAKTQRNSNGPKSNPAKYKKPFSLGVVFDGLGCSLFSLSSSRLCVENAYPVGRAQIKLDSFFEIFYNPPQLTRTAG
jgi:hypothetical protein